MKIKPVNGYLLIEITKVEKTKGGIFLDIRNDLITEQAKVIAVPKGSDYKAGDTVLYKAYGMDTVEIDNKPYHFIKEEEVRGII